MLKSTFFISTFSILSRISGYIRDIVIASYLGTGILNDIFIACFRIPNFFRGIVAEGVVNLAFVPVYKSFKNDKSHQFNKSVVFSSSLFFLFLITIIPVFILTEIYMHEVIYFLSPGFKNTEFSLYVIDIARIIFPYTIFVILNSILIGILNANNRFIITSGIQILLNLIICFALITASSSKINSVNALAWSCIISGVLQSLVLYFSIKKKYRIIIIMPKISKEVKAFFLMLTPSIIIFSIFQINKFVIYYLASYEVSAISYIYYADRLFQLPVGIITLSITTAMLPIASKLILDNQFDAAKVFFGNAFQYIMLFAIPSAFVFFYYSELIVSLLFERGQFTELSVINTANSLKFLALGLPAFAVIPLFNQLFMIYKQFKIFILGNIIISLINFFIASYLFNLYGYIGIIQALVIYYWLISFFVFLYLLFSKINFFTLRIFYTTVKIIISSCIMIYFIQYIASYFILQKLTMFCLITFTGLLTYFLATFIINFELLNPIYNLFFRRKKIN